MSSADTTEPDPDRASPLAVLAVGVVLVFSASPVTLLLGFAYLSPVAWLEFLFGAFVLVAGLQALWSDSQHPVVLRAIDRVAARLETWFDRSWGHVARTAGVVGGSGLAVLSLAALVEYATRDFGPCDVCVGIALGFLFLVLLVVAGLVLLGFGLSFPGGGGRFSVPPVGLSPVQRLLVTGGAMLATLGPPTVLLSVALGDAATPLGSVGSFVASVGVRLLLFGLVWTLAAAAWRRLHALGASAKGAV